MLTPDLEKHGQILLEADTTIRAMVFISFNCEFKYLYCSSSSYNVRGHPSTLYTMEISFLSSWMRNRNGKWLRLFFDVYSETERANFKIEFEAPKGFRIDSVDIANDYDKMHSVWPYRATAPPEILRLFIWLRTCEVGKRTEVMWKFRLRLENLPSVCVRAEDGNLASWEMTHAFGQVLSNTVSE